jgi:hypothetical protein
LKWDNPNWAKAVIERFKEQHEKELLESPLFRKKVLEMVLKRKPNAMPAIPGAPSNDEQIQELMRLEEKDFLPEPEPGGKFETWKEKAARKKLDALRLGEPLPDLYTTFMEECPNCICSKCLHANECIERIRPGD